MYAASDGIIADDLRSADLLRAPYLLAMRLAHCLALERERWILWLAVAYGAGIAGYFSLSFEPPLWLALAGAGVGGAIAWALPGRDAARWFAALLAFAAAGFAMAELHRIWHAAPILDSRSAAVTIEGQLIDIDRVERGFRATIAPQRIENYGDRPIPARVRVRLKEADVTATPGDLVTVRALLMPPPGPSLPGGYDFQRDAYFARLGAVGFSLGPLQLASAGSQAQRASFPLWMTNLRAHMTQRIEAVLPGAIGGMASALITGKRGALDPSTIEAFRDSGLSHLLAIAGLHMSLVGGFVFLVTRVSLALIPWVALRWPLRKMAAMTALLFLFLYLMLSGAAMASQRAFIMNGLVLVAIFIDRMRLSMRVCALAAVVVLTINPAGLAGASFQLSFGAVIAMVAFYESSKGDWRQGLHRLGLHRLGFLRHLVEHGGAVIVTTVIATLGTEGFSIYQFNHLAFYAPLANLVAVPLSTVWTMPLALISCLLMPFDLEAWALIPMGWGITATIWVAEFVAGLPGNVWVMPRLPDWGIALFAAGGLWLCLWRRGWRWWGALPMILGLASMLTTRPPDLILSGDGQLAAIRANGVYRVSSATRDRVTLTEWQHAAGDTTLWPLLRDHDNGPVPCRDGACHWEAPDGRSLLLVLDRRALAKGCPNATAIVSLVRLPRACHDRQPAADPLDSQRSGSQAFWLDPRHVRVLNANDTRGDRPWVLRRPLGAQTPPPDATVPEDSKPAVINQHRIDKITGKIVQNGR